MIYNELLETYYFKNKFRLGDNSDGGYVICDLDGTYDSYICCGVGDMCRFDGEFLQKYNYIKKEDAFAFDGTINNYCMSTENINFIKKNISNKNDNLHTNLHDLIDKYNDIFLSMDIEGFEYLWLQSLTLDQLKSFKQIAIELHDLNNNDNQLKIAMIINGLEKLNKTHYIVHSHGNNYAGIYNNIPDVLELTLIRKNYFTDIPLKNMIPLPIKYLDYPNNKDLPDHGLNVYPFTNQLYHRIYIGPSEENVKEIHLTRHYAFNTQLFFFHNFMDKFDYQFIASNKILVKRMDKDLGWGQELYCFYKNNNKSLFSLINEDDKYVSLNQPTITEEPEPVITEEREPVITEEREETRESDSIEDTQPVITEEREETREPNSTEDADEPDPASTEDTDEPEPDSIEDTEPVITEEQDNTDESEFDSTEDTEEQEDTREPAPARESEPDNTEDMEEQEELEHDEL